ncbi:unnamed protein product [Bursaphelenchus xylophilus]|uniref:UDP-glucuronosyltransferase n=1 Tax=Bursaphelenchus xylophilus TaxID=6326 RepID=A0A7I8WMK2_BURXY|nr:unnamed protein product [Bursaphelenchus xylophilus]CAG9092101.1 unnamed protein product [Bursaphelenchus xylophilus]
MNSFFVALFLLSLPQVHGYRYLFQVINFAYSHMSFGGRLADLLVENGHEVDFVIRRYNTFVSGAAAKKANVSVHTLANVEELNQLTMRVPMYHDVFTQSGDAFTWEGLNVMDELMTKGCDATLEDKGYMNLLRSKKYDAAFVEHVDSCGLFVANVLGIDKIMYFSVHGLAFPSRNDFSIPSPPGLVPVYNEVPPSGHLMSFFDRVVNLYNYLRYHILIPMKLRGFSGLKPRSLPPNSTSNADLAAGVIYSFVNSLEFLNFPDFSTPQIKQVGGIGMPKAEKIDAFLQPIFEKAKKGVVWLSFGSIVNTKQMSPAIRGAFISAFSRFKDYQFLWQMENADDPEIKSIFEAIPNIHVAKWVNQPALLAHPKTKAMISHGGITGLFEAINFGVPLISVPMFMDQKRTAALTKYHGIGVILDKYTLTADSISEALKAVLENPSYKENILRKQAMMKDAPQRSEQVFLDAVSYATKYGDELKKVNIPPMSWVQYFCVDAALFIFAVFVTALWVTIFAARKLGTVVARQLVANKMKSEKIA